MGLSRGPPPMTAPSQAEQLARIEARLIAAPDKVELIYLRAGLLAELGRDEAARAGYLAALALEPTHFGALNDLGTLLYRTDFRAAARTAYAEAVKHHPDNPIGHINLANALLADGQAQTARDHFETALSLAPDHPDAHQGLANLLQDLGEATAAEVHRQKSYARRGVIALPYRGQGPPCRVLVLVSAVGGNVPTRFLFDDALFAVHLLPVEAQAELGDLPEHDLVFNAVGDVDLCGEALEAVEVVLARTQRPVINRPEAVRLTGRAAIAQRMTGLPGLIAPRVESVPRETLRQAARRFGYPLLLRSPGYHTGRHFHRIEDAAGLNAALADLPGRQLLMIDYLDARDAEGHARKYRVMMIDGTLYPLHLAMAADWKVHYFTADMAERPDHRALEAAFLADMAAVLGPRAMAALDAVAARLGLDYAGIDFGLNADGDLLLFEANATMVVNPPDADPRWDYRREPVARILAAAQAMMLRRGGLGATPAT